MFNKKRNTSSIIIVLLFTIILVGCSNQNTTHTTQTTEPMKHVLEPSNAFKLASLEVGHNDPNQDLQNQFSDLLAELTQKCPNESENDIANYIYKTKTMIEERGGQISLLESAISINESIPPEAAGSVSCAEIASIFVALYISN